MSNDAPDKVSHERGKWWYAGLALIAYVASFAPALFLSKVLLKFGLFPSALKVAMGLFYAPIMFVIWACGLVERYIQFDKWITQLVG